MLILDSKPLSYDKAFSHAGVSYPANWLRLSTWEEKQRIGITEIPDPAQQSWDQRFYWGVDNPKDHAGLVDLWVGKVKDTAATLLAPSDWYVTRNSENGSVIPQAVLDRRAEIRTYSNIKEAAIQATTSTDELSAYVTSSSFSEWEPPAPVEELVSGSSEPIPAPGGNDTLLFSTGTTGASIL